MQRTLLSNIHNDKCVTKTFCNRIVLKCTCKKNTSTILSSYKPIILSLSFLFGQVLDGNISEEHYDWPTESDSETSSMEKNGTSEYNVNEVAYICGKDVFILVVQCRLLLIPCHGWLT